MENRGYEEEQSRAEEERLAHESRYRERQPRAIGVVRPESHVYEDITASAESDLSEPKALLAEEDARSVRAIEGQLARQTWIGGPTSVANNDALCQQSSTLPSSAGISTNRRDSWSNESDGLRWTSEDAAEGSSGEVRREPERLPRGDDDVAESVLASARENEDASGSQPDRKPVANRRRRKKDCKHCRSKLAAAAGSCEKLDALTGKDANLNDGDRADASGFPFRDSLLRSQNIKIYPIIDRTSLRDGLGNRRSSLAAYPVSATNGPARLAERAAILVNVGVNNVDETSTGKATTESKSSKLPGTLRNGTDMRVNSIYSQDRWYGKETPIFYTDVKDQNPFQRAYSLPIRTHTPASQNRVNLRRSVRNEPPPHPARLDKHRRGWTLHLARPLKTSGCSGPLLPLLVVVLILLGVAGVALYIVFEPEKLQIIQQYLKSSTSKLTGQNVTSGEPFTPMSPNDEPDLTIETTETTSSTATMTTVTMKTSADDAFIVSSLLNGEQSFPEIASPSTDAETEAANQNANATRHCDDCLGGEVCVALVDEEVPICRRPRDREDPTGCAGFCVINKQKCHRLDVDAFRCVEIEHYCLDDEWTCSNTLCIPLEKRCDGHMNCYDHSDEYDCECNPETHFQCGNETSCLSLERRCDGKIDCWDATDEINCTLACPLENEFTCSNGECILKVRFCDRLPDCSDGSDEPHGCQGRCNKHEFTCQNGRCITKEMKCNGVDDCGDSTDERYCKDRFI